MRTRRVVKEILRPGAYVKNGELVVVDENDVAHAFAMMGKLDQTNLDVPVILEHVEPEDGQKEGVPLDRRRWNDNKADELRRTVGVSVFRDGETRINEEGGLEVALDVRSDIADQMDAGFLKFVSPELRPNWTDGKGREYHGVPTHIAITHRPIQVDQRPGFRFIDSPPAGAQSLALSDSDHPLWLEIETMAKAKTPSKPARQTSRRGHWSSVKQLVDRLALAEDEGGERLDEEETPRIDPPENDDMPAGPDQELQALIAHLTKLGLALPSGVTRENLVEHLLTAVMTANAVAALGEREEQERNPDLPDDARIEEVASNNLQFGDNSPHARLISRITAARQSGMTSAVADSLLARVGLVQFAANGEEIAPRGGGMRISDAIAMFETDARERQFSAGSPQARVRERIERMRRERLIEPGLADKLLGRVAVAQFSDGREVATNGVSITSILDSLETSRSAVARLMGEESRGYNQNERQLSDAAELEHPNGGGWDDGHSDWDVGGEKAVKEARRLLTTHTSVRRRSPDQISPDNVRQFSTQETLS